MNRHSNNLSFLNLEFEIVQNILFQLQLHNLIEVLPRLMIFFLFRKTYLKNFFNQLDEMQLQKRNNELIYSEEEYKIGQKKGKAEVERLDKIRKTDIKKILAKNKKALEWWTSI